MPAQDLSLFFGDQCSAPCLTSLPSRLRRLCEKKGEAAHYSPSASPRSCLGVYPEDISLREGGLGALRFKGRPCLSSNGRALSFLAGGFPLPSSACQEPWCLRPGSLAPGPSILFDGPLDRGLLGDTSPISRGATNGSLASECCSSLGISIPVERKWVRHGSFLFHNRRRVTLRLGSRGRGRQEGAERGGEREKKRERERRAAV